jgi:hypothetical protein
MIYDRPAPDDRPYYRPPYQPQYSPERPAYQPFETLAEGKLVLEYKTFLFSLRENQRGRVLRISEVANGRFNTIMIPASGLDDVLQIVNEMVKADGEIPASPPGDLAPKTNDSPVVPVVAKTAQVEVEKIETVAKPAARLAAESAAKPAVKSSSKPTAKENKIKGKALVAEIFKAEDPSQPLSDLEVVKMLAEKGIKTTRRTVAVYREELGILASYERKAS